jgi:hypothetical protein
MGSMDAADDRLHGRRQQQIRRAKAQIVLAVDELGAALAVIVLNDLLRASLDQLKGAPREG